MQHVCQVLLMLVLMRCLSCRKSWKCKVFCKGVPQPVGNTGRHTQNKSSEWQHHRALTEDPGMQQTFNLKTLGEQILLIHFSKGSGLRDLRKCDSRWNYSCVRATSEQQSSLKEVGEFTHFLLFLWHVSVDNFWLSKTKLKYISLLKRACISCFGKTSQGSVLKEESQGEHFLFVMIFTVPLSLTEKIPCRIGKQQIISMACGCGIGCLVGASKSKFF